MKIRRSQRGIHERFRFMADDGSPLQMGKLSEDEEQKLRRIGFWGIEDFLSKAESLAEKVLSEHRLPTEWPLPATQKLLGKYVPAMAVPDRLIRKNLKKLSPSAEFAAELKHDVTWCRQLLGNAEFRAQHMQPRTTAKELLYAGAIAGLAYWCLRAQHELGDDVVRGRRNQRSQKKASKEGAKARRKIGDRKRTMVLVEGRRELVGDRHYRRLRNHK